MPNAVHSPVSCRRALVSMPFYQPAAPDKNPMFLEKRVYQGSSGAVYPLPFYDRISENAEAHEWEAVFLENDFLEVMLLPELGGRIHRLRDKHSGEDLIYHQTTIKPALVGLAGPWVSGGIEFNWPQHHRPSTFMPTATEVVHGEDGSVTVWLSEHDPLARMKGMHGVCLYPDRALLELKVRAYNRTGEVQTFLWWANLAARVHESYQSFFPPDARVVADHAKRATSTFPCCEGLYYGINYAERAQNGVPSGETPPLYKPTGAYPANDLSWYANIPVPTSYMCLHTRENFFGGYDHKTQLGILHVADRHYAPGKKQWTWGNQEFGYAWDRNLTVPDEHGEYRPYIELMAGAFTDNQPDFSYLQPGETRAWSQYWYPLRTLGPVQQASLEAALSLRLSAEGVWIGVCVTRPQPDCKISLQQQGRFLFTERITLTPTQAWTQTLTFEGGPPPDKGLLLQVHNASGELLAEYQKVEHPLPTPESLSRAVATELPLPSAIESADELYLAGVHLEQYRHATREPEDYWLELLRRDPGDSRANLALGCRSLRRGEFTQAEAFFRAALARLLRRNPNPRDGEAHYQLGRCLRFLGKDAEAYDCFAKASWNEAWSGAAQHALAELSCCQGNWAQALDQLTAALKHNTDNLRARALKVIVLRKLARTVEADTLLGETLKLDPLDWWSRHLAAHVLSCDTQVRFDLAYDLNRAGLRHEALQLLEEARPEVNSGTAPLLHYLRAFLCSGLGDSSAARLHYASARQAAPDYCFPNRLEELLVLNAARSENPQDPRACLYLGHWLYAHRRHSEAIAAWEQCVHGEPSNSVAWRNLGIAYFNCQNASTKAREAYDTAFAAAPQDARILFERDQLWKRIGIPPEERLKELEIHSDLVSLRDDLSLELVTLCNQTGAFRVAAEVLASRHFQPWEGGEGQVLRQYVRTALLHSTELRSAGQKEEAYVCCRAALQAPANLGEAPHPLANRSELFLTLGDLAQANGKSEEAEAFWQQAANSIGDFQDMSVCPYSELSYYAALALVRLGRADEARSLLQALLGYAQTLEGEKARIDYFATSLPDLLLFEDDLQHGHKHRARFMQAQAHFGLGRESQAIEILKQLLTDNPNHAQAADLFRQATEALNTPTRDASSKRTVSKG